jgi:DNA modification methylase
LGWTQEMIVEKLGLTHQAAKSQLKSQKTGEIVEGDCSVQVEADNPKQTKRLNELDGRTWTRNSISVWNVVKTPEENKLSHPAMFPVELCKRLIEIYTKRGDTVIDPFMGSGSTLVAARELDRRGIGFEVRLTACWVGLCLTVASVSSWIR